MVISGMKLLSRPVQTHVAAFVLLICAPGAFAQVNHMVVIGVDGLSPDGVLKAKSTTLHGLMKAGAWSLHARGVMPTSSSPNWASMIMGAGPEQHGVTSNEWQPDKFEIAPIATGSGGIFPTIFGILREQRPRAIMGVFHDWDDYGRLFERKAVTVIKDTDGPTNAVHEAAAFWKDHKATFTFIHLDHVDHAGHEIGHGTPEYYESVEVADKLIGEAIEALRSSGMWERTILLVTADHGGHGKGHGQPIMADLEIPWIITGPGVKAGHEIKSHINTYDTAATIAYVFGLKPPEVWIGRPVREAFKAASK
jgi:predicted AlkP superfamily pyrophosphatase or phosphodiesterase